MALPMSRNLGLRVLAVWLILAAVLQLVPGMLGVLGLVLPVLQLIAGILILMGR